MAADISKLNCIASNSQQLQILTYPEDVLTAIKQNELDAVVVYSLDEVVVELGEWLSQGKTKLPEKGDLLELRAFSNERELLIRNVNGGLRGRLRIDGSGEPCEVLDEEHLLVGKFEKTVGAKERFSEDSGACIEIPTELFGKVKPSKGIRASITVRNYVAESEKGSFEFNGYRFMELNLRQVIDDE